MKVFGVHMGAGHRATILCFSSSTFWISHHFLSIHKTVKTSYPLLEGQGLRVVVYLDDGIVAVSGEQEAQRASAQVQEDLGNEGFVKNKVKCSWTPSQQSTWLGFELDLQQGRIKVPKTKIDAPQSLLKDALSKCCLPAKTISSITGKIIAMSPGLGPVTRLMTRSFYALLSTSMSWLQILPLSEQAIGDLCFWYQEIERFNGHSFWIGPSAVRVVFTDASDSGYAGYTVQHWPHIAQGTWLQEESTKSSTWHELRAVRVVLDALATKLANE